MARATAALAVCVGCVFVLGTVNPELRVGIGDDNGVGPAFDIDLDDARDVGIGIAHGIDTGRDDGDGYDLATADDIDLDGDLVLDSGYGPGTDSDDAIGSDIGPDLARGNGLDNDSDNVDAPVRSCCWTAADVLAARATASPRARCVVDREVGGVGYDPWAVGRAGERGPVQLHPRGLLPTYVAWSGGAAPENPYRAIPFLDAMLARGEGRHWSPIRLGLC